MVPLSDPTRRGLFGEAFTPPWALSFSRPQYQAQWQQACPRSLGLVP